MRPFWSLDCRFRIGDYRWASAFAKPTARLGRIKCAILPNEPTVLEREIVWKYRMAIYLCRLQVGLAVGSFSENEPTGPPSGGRSLDRARLLHYKAKDLETCETAKRTPQLTFDFAGTSAGGFRKRKYHDNARGDIVRTVAARRLLFRPALCGLFLTHGDAHGNFPVLEAGDL